MQLACHLLALQTAALLTKHQCNCSWPNWDYDNLCFQKRFVAAKYLGTAKNVYSALEALHSSKALNPGDAPKISLLGCGAGPEYVACQVRHC